MSIQRKPQAVKTRPADAQAIEAFIAGAPDAGAAQLKPARQKKKQIAHQIQGDLLERIVARANRMGVSRAALINLYCFRGLEDDDSREKN